MELNVTRLFSHEKYNADDICNSIMNLGKDAATITWNNALALANHIQLIKGKVDKAEVIDALMGYGAWYRSEMEEWTMKELNALVFQFITGDMDEAMDGAGIKGWRKMTIKQLFEAWPDQETIDEVNERLSFSFYIQTTKGGKKEIWYSGFN